MIEGKSPIIAGVTVIIATEQNYQIRKYDTVPNTRFKLSLATQYTFVQTYKTSHACNSSLGFIFVFRFLLIKKVQNIKTKELL